MDPHKKKLMEFGLKALAILAPALISGYFSYATAKAEANAKANAGYEALVSEVRKLQEAAEKSTTGVAKLEGRMETMEKVALRPVTLSGSTAPAGGAGMGVLSAPPLKPLDRTKLMKPEDLFQKSELPPNLDSAYKQSKK